MTHPVPVWARPLLQAAAFLHRAVTGIDGPLFTDPIGATGLPRLRHRG
ncbi:hypothetical protein J7F03_39675 [Streptomyces sp. ISL-43]|nr:hypothetical protein [Streptomyces sp. ISL-43]MBT2453041.1 hypothetical protein [Streptomyces sp. ISL-43]